MSFGAGIARLQSTARARWRRANERLQGTLAGVAALPLRSAVGAVNREVRLGERGLMITASHSQ